MNVVNNDSARVCLPTRHKNFRFDVVVRWIDFEGFEESIDSGQVDFVETGDKRVGTEVDESGKSILGGRRSGLAEIEEGRVKLRVLKCRVSSSNPEKEKIVVSYLQTVRRKSRLAT